GRSVTAPKEPHPLHFQGELSQTTLAQGATRIYDMLVDRGYTGSLRTLRRFVLPNRPAVAREVYVRVETLPGEQSQIDWAHVGHIRVRGGVRPLYCFVLLLRYSRALWAELVLEQT